MDAERLERYLKDDAVPVEAVLVRRSALKRRPIEVAVRTQGDGVRVESADLGGEIVELRVGVLLADRRKLENGAGAKVRLMIDRGRPEEIAMGILDHTAGRIGTCLGR